MLEAVIGLPDQLFYNTGISTYVWIVTNRKRKERRGKVQLINGTDFAWKMKKSLGDKRKQIGDGTEGAPNHIEVLTKLYGDFEHDVRMTVGEIQTNVDPKRDQTKSLFVSKIFDNQDFGYLKITVERPLRLNFAVTDERIDAFQAHQRLRRTRHLPEAEGQEEDHRGGTGRRGSAGRHSRSARRHEGRVRRRPARQRPRRLRRTTRRRFRGCGHHARWQTPAARCSRPAASASAIPSAEICRDKKGNPEPDPELRDTENVPFPPGIALPLPLDYEGKKNKGKVDVEPLLALVRDHCEAYLAAEVLPYRPDAWIDHSKIKVGYEIPFNRHFYEYEAPRPLDKIEKDIDRSGEGNHGHAEGGRVMRYPAYPECDASGAGLDRSHSRRTGRCGD